MFQTEISFPLEQWDIILFLLLLYWSHRQEVQIQRFPSKSTSRHKRTVSPLWLLSSSRKQSCGANQVRWTISPELALKICAPPNCPHRCNGTACSKSYYANAWCKWLGCHLNCCSERSVTSWLVMHWSSADPVVLVQQHNQSLIIGMLYTEGSRVCVLHLELGNLDWNPLSC